MKYLILSLAVALLVTVGSFQEKAYGVSSNSDFSDPTDIPPPNDPPLTQEGVCLRNDFPTEKLPLLDGCLATCSAVANYARFADASTTAIGGDAQNTKVNSAESRCFACCVSVSITYNQVIVAAGDVTQTNKICVDENYYNTTNIETNNYFNSFVMAAPATPQAPAVPTKTVSNEPLQATCTANGVSGLTMTFICSANGVGIWEPESGNVSVLSAVLGANGKQQKATLAVSEEISVQLTLPRGSNNGDNQGSMKFTRLDGESAIASLKDDIDVTGGGRGWGCSLILDHPLNSEKKN